MRNRTSILCSVLTLLFALTAATAVAQTYPYVKLFSCVTSGAGDQYLKICVSNRGNVTHFESPQGQKHVWGLEGYALCRTKSAVPSASYDAGTSLDYWDTPYPPEAGWSAPAISQPSGRNAFPLIITRTTTDGAMRLKQTFSRDTFEKDLTITMALTNTSGRTLSNVYLDRFADFNIDNDGREVECHSWPMYPTDIFDTTLDSVTAREVNGMLLRGLTGSPNTTVLKAFPYDTGGTPGDDGALAPHLCNQRYLRSASACHGDDVNDFAGRVSVPLGTMVAGKTVTVKFLYRRF